MRALLAILRIGLRSLREGRGAHMSQGAAEVQAQEPAGAPTPGPAGAAAQEPAGAPTEPRAALSGGLRRAPGVRLAVVVALSSLAGALSGLLPAAAGAALGAVAGRAATPSSGPGGALARLLDGAPPSAAVLAALGATLASASAAVLSGRKSSELAGDLTAALRVALFRAALSASPRDVDAAGRALLDAHAAGPAAPAAPRPPGGVGAGAGARPSTPARPAAPAAPARGAEVVRLAIARDAGLVADFAIAFATGLPQALATLAVLAASLVSSGMATVLAGGAALFAASRVAADRASGRVARAMREMQHADTAVFGALGEALAGAEDLRLLGARAQAEGELAGAAYRVADARRRFGQALAVSGQIKGVLAALAPLVIVAAIAASRGDAGAGEVGELLLVVPLLMARLEALDALRAGFIERAPLLRATLDLLRLPEHPPRPAGGPRRADGSAARLDGEAAGPLSIALERVTFTPPGASRPVLEDVSFSIPAGAVVGVCGRSGSGKSMLLRLLLRLDEPSSGAIAVGGVDLRQIPPEELPRLFGVVGQSARLFERSVADNLALGLAPAPSEERMREALRRVELDALAGEAEGPAGEAARPAGEAARPAGEAARPAGEAARPAGARPARGLATEVRASPPSLSGGEARRLLLARVLLREPRVFVLDEPEAGLPGATAEALLRTVCEVAAGRTAIVVTHAPHLLRSTFNVLLDEGRVAAVGTHEDLRERSPLYRSLLAEALKRSPAPARPDSG
ncbi:ABC transporter ATP-binding protein [Sorangium sp. So ce134]